MRLTICKCKGGGGGGSEGSSDELEKKAETGTAQMISGVPVPLPKPVFNFAALIDDKIVIQAALYSLIMSKPLSLTFKGNAYLSPSELEDLHEFFDAIKAEFAQFKAELKAQGVPVEDFTVEQNNNDLTLNIPNANAFNQFVQRLLTGNYLPNNFMAEMAKLVQAETPLANNAVRSSLPTPLSTVPRPLPKDLKD